MLLDGLTMPLTNMGVKANPSEMEYIMAKKTMNKVEERTMQVVMSELKDKIDNYNLESNAAKRNTLEVDCKNLVAEYNEMSLLDAYATFKAEADPMVALAKAYTYDVISAKATSHQEMVNGVKKSIVTMVLDENRTKLLNAAKFIEWMAERNVSVTARADWRKRVNNAHKELISQWKSFIEDGTDFKVGALKTALQDMVDAFIVLEGENGKNAYVVTSKLTRSIIAFCTSRKDGLKGTIAAKNTWERLQMDILHAVVTRKEFEIAYDDPDEAEAETETEEEAAE